MIGWEVRDRRGDKVNLGHAIRVGFADALSDSRDSADVLVVQAEEHHHQIRELRGADSADFGEAGSRIYKDVIRLEMMVDGGLPVHEKGRTEPTFVKLRPVDMGELMVVGGVSPPGRHDVELAPQRAGQFTAVNKRLNVRRDFMAEEFSDVFDNTRFSRSSGPRLATGRIASDTWLPSRSVVALLPPR